MIHEILKILDTTELQELDKQRITTDLLRLFSWNDLEPSLEPFTGELCSFLLMNALRFLTEEQKASLCFDLYCRNQLAESIDKRIELLKLERQAYKQ